jgi:acyl-CoA synthetase (NDP forming)
MIDCVRARALLEGFRGGPVVDKDAIKDVILRVSRLVQDFPEVLEVDLNPLTARGEGVVAVDGRLRV